VSADDPGLPISPVSVDLTTPPVSADLAVLDAEALDVGTDTLVTSSPPVVSSSPGKEAAGSAVGAAGADGAVGAAFRAACGAVAGAGAELAWRKSGAALGILSCPNAGDDAVTIQKSDIAAI
jgi:hypothetical protein